MDGSLGASLSLDQAASVAWDAIVIGAGPAGSVAACGLARQGRRTLLVDRAAFPRAKVCGCCIAPTGARRLHALGMGEALREAAPITSVRLVTRRRSATAPLRGYVSIGRDILDTRLASLAESAGCSTLWPASARVLTAGRVRVTQYHAERVLTASVVVVADGLGGTSLSGAEQSTWTIGSQSRMGAGAMLTEPPLEMRRGEIAMLCDRSGYLGIVRLPDDRFDLAAAFDPAVVRRGGGPANLAAEYLRQVHGNPQAALAARWKATGLLTRRRRSVEGDRLLLVGDASGYVEPITGEGISWAIESGAACVEHAMAFARGSHSAGAWRRAHAQLMSARKRRCALVARALRSPMLVGLAQYSMSAYPGLADFCVQRLVTSRAPLQATHL